MYQDIQAHFNNNQTSQRSRFTAFWLCLFFGFSGAHRFYTDHVISGVIWILSSGLFGIGLLMDLLWIIFGIFTDDQGRYLE
jgi:TM2 domain-containing membrane protein YozV